MTGIRHPRVEHHVQGLLNSSRHPLDTALLDPLLKHTLDRWASGNHPYEPGGFLMACLRGEWEDALRRGDMYNLVTFGTVMAYMYNHLPSSSWGTPEKYDRWLETMRKERFVEVDNG